MSTKKTPHRHHDPAFPAEARELGERIASALERIADAQERRAFSQESSNKQMSDLLAQVIPLALSFIRKPGDADRAATPAPRKRDSGK
jgi:hypothetical protein